MNRILKFPFFKLSLIAMVLPLVALFVSWHPGAKAQQTLTEDVTIVPLRVPENVIGTYFSGASNDGRRLVIESINDYNGRNVDSNTEIWVYDVDTSQMIMITDTADVQERTTNTDGTVNIKTLLKVSNLGPTISGDGTHIVFQSNAAIGDSTNPDGNFEIYVAHLPRGSVTPTFKRITDTGPNYTDETVKEFSTNYAPAISDDGQTVAFLSTRNLFRPIEGGPAAFTALKEGAASTDPDGNAELFVYRESTRQYTQVTATRDVDATTNFIVQGFNGAPYLSGNGQVITFLSSFNFPGTSANANPDFNAELFVHKVGDPVNRLTQVTRTDGLPATPLLLLAGHRSLNVLSAGTRPINFDGTKVVFESAADLAGKNSDRTREVFLVDLSGTTPAFQQLTDQSTVDAAKNDYGFSASINSVGTYVVFSTTLNLVPATTSSVTTDNGDGSRELYRYHIPTAKFLQLTFTPLSDLIDQRANRSNPRISDAGDRASFSFDPRLFLPQGASISDLFQAVVRPALSRNSVEPKIANAASFDSTQVARGSIAAIFGTQLSNDTASATSSDFPTQMNGVSVKVAGIAARLIYVSPSQINVVLPLNIANADAVDFSINNNGVISAGKVKVVDLAPGVFTIQGDGKGPAVAQCGQLSPDGLSFPLTAPPCDVGNDSQFNTLVIYLTGVHGGRATTQVPIVVVKIGDQTLNSSTVSAQPEFPGLDQINVPLVGELATKTDQEITITAGTTDSNKSTVSFTSSVPSVTTFNAASFQGGEVAPGSLAVVRGTGLAAASVTADGSELPFSLGGVTATFAGKPVRLSAVSDASVTIVVPEDIKPAERVEVTINNSGKLFRGRVNVSKASPGLFTRTNDGEGAVVAKCGVVNPDLAVTYTDPPCAVGTETAPKQLRLFGTGWRFADTVTVKIGDSDVKTVAVGPQPGAAGRDIIDLELVPALLGKTDVDVVVTTKVGGETKSSRTGIKVSFTSSN